MSPSILFYLNSEPNPSAGVFNRMPQNAEVYGLKLLNLLLPRLNHRWDFLSRIHSDYMSLTATEMETEIASLGIIGAVGFLILLSVFFFHIKSNNRFIEDIAYLNICTIIIGIMGGGRLHSGIFDSNDKVICEDINIYSFFLNSFIGNIMYGIV